MMQSMNGGGAGQMGGMPGGGGAGGMPDMSALMGLMGGGGGGMGGAPPVVNPEEAYASQIQQLVDMVRRRNLVYFWLACIQH